MAQLYRIKATQLGEFPRDSIVTVDELGGVENAERLAGLGALELAPEGSTPVKTSHWGGLTSYDTAKHPGAK